MYHRRVEAEWADFNSLVSLNIARFGDIGRRQSGIEVDFVFDLLKTPSFVRSSQQPAALEVIETHSVKIRFPRFFPAVPMEVRVLSFPVHPNIDPLNGYICLWAEHHPLNTVGDSLWLLEGMLTWRICNEEDAPNLQPEAYSMLRQPGLLDQIPLAHSSLLNIPDEFTRLKRAGTISRAARTVRIVEDC